MLLERIYRGSLAFYRGREERSIRTCPGKPQQDHPPPEARAGYRRLLL